MMIWLVKGLAGLIDLIDGAIESGAPCDPGTRLKFAYQLKRLKDIIEKL